MLFQDSIDNLIRYVRNGDDDSLRASAISKLSIEFMRSDDPVIGGLIAEFVCDPSVNSELRKFAYLCLFDVSRRTHNEYPNLKSFRFPEDVDWNFMAQFSSKS